MGPRCSSAETQVCHRSYIIAATPGPDNIFSKLLINADITDLDFLLQIFIKSWNEGYLPKQWKKANVKFLKKNRKT